MNSGEFQAHAEQIERMVAARQRASGRRRAHHGARTLQSLMDLHGAALARIIEVLSESGDAGRNSLAALGSDPLLCGLMVLYGVHPLALEERVARAHREGPPAAAEARRKRRTHRSQRRGRKGKDPEFGARLWFVFRRAEIAPSSRPSWRPRQRCSHHGRGLRGCGFSGFVPLSMIQPVTKEEKRYEKSTA